MALNIFKRRIENLTWLSKKLWLSQFIKVELGSKAGALKQMLLEVLDDPNEIRRICIMGRHCTLYRGSKEINCDVSTDKYIAEGNSLI